MALFKNVRNSDQIGAEKADKANDAVVERMAKLHEEIMAIPLPPDPEPTPGELYIRYREEAIERIQAAVGEQRKAPGDALAASGLLPRKGKET